MLFLSDWDVEAINGSLSSNISLQNGLLRLAMSQAPTTFTPSASALLSDATYAYGTYEFAFRASSTANLPTTAGTAVEGSLTYVGLYLDATRSISAIISGSATNNARNSVQFVTQNGASTSIVFPTPAPENSFQSLKFIWSAGKIDFYLNGKFAQTFTTNVPTSAMKIRLAHYGANNAIFGGLGTATTPRYAYVSFVRYTPSENYKFFTFEVNENEQLIFTLAPIVTVTARDFAFLINENTSHAFILNTATSSTVTTRIFSFAISETVAHTVAILTVPNPSVSRAFTFTINEIENITPTLTLTGGAVAATTGWLNPTATVTNGWTNPTAIFASDDARTSCVVAAGAFTPELWAYGFSGLSIPEGAIINGIRVNVEGSQTGTIASSFFRLVNANTFIPKSATPKSLTLTAGGAITASNTGLKNAGTAFLTGWTSPTSSLVQDGTSASVTVTAAETPYAIWSNFDFSSIPVGASITGVEVIINGRSTVASDYSYFRIGFVEVGAPFSVISKTAALPVSATTTAWVTMGGPGDLWGGLAGSNALTRADLTTTFGVAGAWGTTAANTFFVDGVQFKVYYTTGTGSEAIATLGTTADLWGNVDTTNDDVAERIWSSTDFNSNFAFWGQFLAGTGGATVSIDNVQLNVSYTTPGAVIVSSPAIALPSKIVATYMSPYGGGGDVAMGTTMAALVNQAYNQVHIFHAVPVGGDLTTIGRIRLLNEAGANVSVFCTLARVQAIRAKGIRVVLVVGGAGWRMNFNSVQSTYDFTGDDPAFPGVVGANSIQSIYNALGGFDGVDFNTFEAAGIDRTVQVVQFITITRWLHTKYGTNFSVSCPPAHYDVSDRAMVQTWNAAGTGGALDFVTPQIYDDPSGPGDVIYTPTVLYNASVNWIPIMGNIATKVTMGTGANYYRGASVASNKTALTNLRTAYPGFRGTVGWSTVDDQNAGVPWSFANQLITVP